LIVCAELETLEQLQQERPKNRTALLYDLGFSSDYGTVWKFQKNLVDRRVAAEIADSLILVEHDHVLTMGRNSHEENILVGGLPRFEIERGGDVTYHGPGQLVAYPIVSLTENSLGVRQYVELLEKSVIDLLGGFGLTSIGKLGKLTGVWVEGKRKIASIGVACAHWVTYHGLALNVSTNLSYFQKIKPCGFEAGIMTSLEKELGHGVEMSEVKEKFLESFSKTFDLTLQVENLP
jgi:lipoyl(octanoyl) transferase